MKTNLSVSPFRLRLRIDNHWMELDIACIKLLVDVVFPLRHRCSLYPFKSLAVTVHSHYLLTGSAIAGITLLNAFLLALNFIIFCL